MSRDPDAARMGRHLFFFHIASLVFTGVALGLTATGLIRGGIAAIVIVLFALISSVETLRILVLSSREPRR